MARARGSKGYVMRQPGRAPLAMPDRGGFWGSLSDHRTHGGRKSYFGALLISLFDAAAVWNTTHTPTPGFPFRVLGQPAVEARTHDMFFRREAVDLLRCGFRLELLAQRLRLLTAERDGFCVQREFGELEGRR